MAKKGIMYFVVMSFPAGLIGYLLFANQGHVKKNKEFEGLEDIYKKFEGKNKLVTTNEIRMMGQRNKVEDVPESDDSSGYM
jgi:hypothetical protein